MRTLAAVWMLAVVGSVGAETIVEVAGPNGPIKADFFEPFGIDADQAGNFYLVELGGGRVFRIDPAGTLTRLAGDKAKGNTGDGGPAVDARFNGMHNLAVAPDGTLLLADTWNHRVRRLDPKAGTIAAFAGTGKKGDSGDGGPALQAEFGGLYCISLDPKGEHLYLTDLDNRRIRAVDMKTGIVRAVAGNGKRGIPEDGAKATEAPLVDPRAAAADASGNVYVLERGGDALRVVSPDGKIRTVVKPGTLKGPKHLCIDRDGSVLIADAENHVIRRYDPKTGELTKVAGTGKRGSAGVGGSPLGVELNRPHGVFVSAAGELYIVDSYNRRVLKIVK